MRKNVIITLITALALLLALLAGCAKDATPEKTDKPVVAVSIVPQQTFVEAVCGELVEVVTMIPPGSSPETYEPTPQQMEKFSAAQIYFAIGVPVEEASILPSAGDVPVVRLQDEVNEAYAPLAFENGEADPHIWLSPRRVKVMVSAIAREMGELDPENAALYQENAEAYNAQLDGLDAAIRDALADTAQKSFIVYHPAFGYFAADYDLAMYSLEEEGKEATVRHLQEMVDLAKRENIKVIFYQDEMDSRQSAQFAEEIGGASVALSPLAADYIDNLLNMANTLAEALK